MDNDLISQGLQLMLAGMGTVFVFLTVLVVVTSLMSRIVMRIDTSGTGEEVSDEELAAITAAISAHRRK